MGVSVLRKPSDPKIWTIPVRLSYLFMLSWSSASCTVQSCRFPPGAYKIKQGVGSQAVTGRKPRYDVGLKGMWRVVALLLNQIKVMIPALIAAMKRWCLFAVICIQRPFELLCDQNTKLKGIYQVGLLSLATYHGITTLCCARSPLKISACSLYHLVNVPTTPEILWRSI